jgi:glyceraldehyde-3-phosphate dehydrogenase/erythrose-4-phosphate dehydrogenase
VRVFVGGYGVIGKRVADAIALRRDMTLVGISVSLGISNRPLRQAA